MDLYTFQAAHWCADCVAKFKAEHVKPAHVDEDRESTYDSDEWPKGPTDSACVEADTPQHCDACNAHLETCLTGDGYAYVRERCAQIEQAAAPDPEDGEYAYAETLAKAARDAGRDVLAAWIEFYPEAWSKANGGPC